MLSADQKATIDAVLEYYGKQGGTRLSDLTHNELPWRQARGDLPDDAGSAEPITHDSMLACYTRQSLHTEGPQRPPLEPRTADWEQMMALGLQAQREWSQTLALLAE